MWFCDRDDLSQHWKTIQMKWMSINGGSWQIPTEYIDLNQFSWKYLKHSSQMLKKYSKNSNEKH